MLTLLIVFIYLLFVFLFLKSCCVLFNLSLSWQSNWFVGPWSLSKTPAICYQKYSRLLLFCWITCREANLGHCMSCGFLCFNFLLVWGKYCFFLWILTTLHFFLLPSWHSNTLTGTSLTYGKANEYKVKYNRGYMKHERHH